MRPVIQSVELINSSGFVFQRELNNAAERALSKIPIRNVKTSDKVNENSNSTRFSSL